MKTFLFRVVTVALIVVGPKDLPKLMRTAGQWAGKARSMADQFRRSFDELARQSELDELRAKVNKMSIETADAARSMVNVDNSTLGLPDNPLGIDHRIEQVGAAPPKAVEAPSVVAAQVDSAMIPHETAVAQSAAGRSG